MNFDELPLLPQLLTAVKACGYETPTPIQRDTIPTVLAGKDVLGCAQTGTGKTAAFALPILQRLYQERPAGKTRNIRALILTPTRELALQIQENFVAYGKGLPLRSCVIFGGVGQQPQVEQLKRGVDILVATPGRLNDLIGQGFISLAKIEIFVLDEADRMLDMGFIHDVKKVIALLPEKRQTLFFSATMPAEVEKLAMSILKDPVSVKVDPVSSTVDTIEQNLYLVDKANKKHLLADLLRRPQVSYADIAPFDPERPELSPAVTDEVEIQIKYAGYLTRQEKQVEEFRKEEARLLPENLDYAAIPGLRLEAREKLAAIHPVSIGQAGRISGVSPADIAVLLIYLEQTNG